MNVFFMQDVQLITVFIINTVFYYVFRSVEGSDLLITFVPASFDDLRLLINGSDSLKNANLIHNQTLHTATTYVRNCANNYTAFTEK